MIRVYDSNERLFNHNGIKTLNPLLAEVKKVDNGDYYIELKDYVENLEYYQRGLIVRVATHWGVQGFRCDNPSVKNNKVECRAWHLSYDSKNYIIKDANAVDKNCNDALAHFNSATDIKSPFTTISDITRVVSTRAVRKSLYDVYEWLISDDKYGGHWVRDNFTLGIRANIGEDRGVVLAQNKNITDMQISENWDDVCTKLLAYTTDGDVAILLDETYLSLNENLYDIPYTKVLKFENPFKKEDYPSEEEFIADTKEWLRTQAITHLQENRTPKVNYSVSAHIENVSDVGDTIYVKHPRCKVDITTQVLSITYDAIHQRYKKIEFGNFKRELKSLREDIVAETNKYTEVKVNENKVLLQDELKEATAKINSMYGSSYVIYDGNEILVVDKLPKENAKYCIKINSAGIGFSQNGIYGTFNSAWTIDGTFNCQVANMINASFSMLRGGVLKLGGSNNSSGSFELYDNTNNLIATMDKEGLTVYAISGDYVKINTEVGFAGFDKNGNKTYWADGDVFHMANAEIENIAKFAGMIQLVPVATSSNKGIGFVAFSN